MNNLKVNDFNKQKQRALETIKTFDRSDKGSVDKPIKKLVNIINSLDEFYTTSSCSGRIILIEIPTTNKKKDFNFLFRKHDTTNLKEIKGIINNYNGTSDVWFRQEPLILHIGCKDLEAADKILKIARPLGLKRGGLFEFQKRFILEIVSTEVIATPVIKEGRIIINDEFLKVLIKEANEKLERTFNKAKKFELLL
jgi:tRNA wybutosine-synthesizing protein 3